MSRQKAAREVGPRRQRSMVPLLLLGLALLALGGAALVVLKSAASGSARADTLPTPAAAAPAGDLAPAPATDAAPAAAAAIVEGPGGSKLTPVTAQDGAIRLAVADFADGQAHFYAFRSTKGPIPFFVMKSSDGVIRAAFDACDVCYPAHKGYHQEGDEMVCNNCGSRFPSARINEVSGGCNPAPLTRQVQGDTLLIKVADLEAGARYFQ